MLACPLWTSFTCWSFLLLKSRHFSGEPETCRFFVKMVLPKMLRKYHHQTRALASGPLTLRLCNLSFSRGWFVCWLSQLATPRASMGITNVLRQATPALEPHMIDIFGYLRTLSTLGRWLRRCNTVIPLQLRLVICWHPAAPFRPL